MSIVQRLDDDMKKAMRAKDSLALSCIRMLKSKMMEKEVALRAKQGKEYKISDQEAEAVVAAYAKQRRDSIESYTKGGRDDLVESEKAELEIVQRYLPEPMGDDELKAIVAEAVAESGASSVRDMGAVMKLVMARAKGAADGKRINEMVRQLLG